MVLEIFQNFLNFFIENNTLEDYLIAFGIFVSLFIIFKLFDSYIIYFFQKATKKTKINWDDFVVNFIEGIHWPFYAYLSFYLAVLYINIPLLLENILNYIMIAFIAFYASKGMISVSNSALDKYKEEKKKKEGYTSESMINVMKFIFKLIIWTLALLMVLSNIGIEITPLIAGLGVGGIAIGLALQSILGDLFSAFAIYFDKPFKEGDFIIVGKDMGIVKNIGIKTTRLQALGGEELVISNSELTSTRINNYKKMNSRRIVFEFGLEYNTKVNLLKQVKKIVTEIINKTKNAELDRVHFKKFGDSSLIFEVVYYVNTNDYNVYMDVQEEINLKIKEKLEKLKINFAFPSRSVYMKK